MSRSLKVCWLFSPIRSGSSVTVYAAAAGLGWPVADEVFGPWDRTGAPYNYPHSQLRLMETFKRTGERLTVEVVEDANRLFREIAERGRPEGLICKHPHASIGPEEARGYWPDHRCVVLLRNPLFALNSLFVRGWDAATGGGSMIGYFSTIAERWLADPHRLVYDDMHRDPTGYFARLFEAWGIEPTTERLSSAVTYRAAHYHHSSKSTEGSWPGDGPSSLRSEREWKVPEPIVAEYLAHPLMGKVFTAAGWPTERRAYPVPTGG